MVSRVTLKATVTTSRDVRERRPPTELELLGQDERRNHTGFTDALIPLTAQQATPE